MFTLNSGGIGISDYTATNDNNEPVSDLNKDITWSQNNSGVITIILGKDSNTDADLPNILLTPEDQIFVKYKSGDGVGYTNGTKKQNNGTKKNKEGDK